MSDTVWATGFWADGFWATGFWSGAADPGEPVTNTTASASSDFSNYLIDDRTGFKVEVRGEGLVQDGHLSSVMTRSKSRDSYHPQERIGSRSDSQRGPQSPEGDDVFISTAISADDL